MDTFGRLPTDVLKYICLMVATPVIKGIENDKTTVKSFRIIIQSPFQSQSYVFLLNHLAADEVLHRINEIDQLIVKKSLIFNGHNCNFKINISDCVNIGHHFSSSSLAITCLPALMDCLNKYKILLQSKIQNK